MFVTKVIAGTWFDCDSTPQVEKPSDGRCANVTVKGKVILLFVFQFCAQNWNCDLYADSPIVFGDRIVSSKSNEFAVTVRRSDGPCFNEPLGEVCLRFIFNKHKRLQTVKSAIHLQETGKSISTFKRTFCMAPTFWAKWNPVCRESCQFWKWDLEAGKLPLKILVSNRGLAIFIDLRRDNYVVARGLAPAIRIVDQTGDVNRVKLD